MTCLRTLISPAELAAHLGRPDWVVIDCRYSLADPAAGEAAYARGHLPGARYAHLDRDLSAPPGPHTGRHPLPDPQRLAARLGRWGVDERTQVVVYDDAGGAFAGRLWWMLHWLGHPCAAVLDGGLQAWERAGGPLTDQVPSPEPRVFKARAEAGRWLSTEAVEEGLRRGAIRLLDARSPERYRGEAEPIDPVAGHIPGALNRPLQLNLGPDGRFLPPGELRRAYAELLAGTEPQAVVHMCGSGVSACHNLLAMEIAGLGGSRLYVGSWSEWIRDPARPVARAGD